MSDLPEELALLGTLSKGRRAQVLELVRARGAEFGIFPLSGAQRRLWFLGMLDPQLPIYHVPYAFALTGRLDEDALRLAFSTLIRRHDMLRAVFFDIDGEPFQAVRPSIPIPFATRPLVALGGAELAGRLDAEARCPFDLRGGPLVRATLYTDGRWRHLLLLTLHHNICDGWSMAIMLGELAECYAAPRERRVPRLREPVRFVDVLSDDRPAAGHLRYWLDALAGAPTTLELPTDHPRPQVQSHQGEQEVFVWPNALRESLARFSSTRHVTTFMTMLTAFAVLLHRHTGREDMLVGAPVAGRRSVAAEQAVGFFVNTVALRLRPRAEASFDGLLAEVREVTLAAQAHDDTPFDLVVESLRLRRDLARQPLVQVCFVVLASENELLELPGLRCELVQGHTGTSKFDLTVSLIGAPDGLRGVVEYDNQIFRRATVQGLIAELRAVLLAGMADPDQRIGALVTDGEDGARPR
jgi:hypothetical protein